MTSGLRIREQDGAITFEVRVTPRASRSRIIGVQEGALKVALAAPPVDGAANEALKKLLAKTLGVSKSDVAIVRGEHARIKVLRVAGLSAADVRFGAG
ncbi:MAG: DUF167 domain-containing protein [Polyangiales bacterium]